MEGANEDTPLVQPGSKPRKEILDEETDTLAMVPGEGLPEGLPEEKETKSVTLMEDLPNILLLFMCYLLQYTVSATLYETIPLHLMEKKVSPTKMGILTFMRYPFGLKFLVAPLTDIYFSASFGRKKSYVVPSQYFLCLLLIFFGLYVEDLIEKEDVWMITIFGILIKGCTAIQDIALDSWVVTLLHPNNYKWGSTCSFIANIFGNLIGFNFLIHFSNLDFCNRFIYDQPRSEPFITTSSFLMYYAVICILITLLVHFFRTEKSQLDDHNRMDLKTIYRTLFCGPCKNKNVMLFMFFVLTYLWSIAPSRVSIVYRLVRKGLKKERLSEFSLFTIPFTILYAITLPSFAVKLGSEMKLMILTVCGKFIESFYWFWVINSYEDETLLSSELVYYYIGGNLFENLFLCLKDIAFMTFTPRIADLKCTGTFITLMYAISNLGNISAMSFVYFMMAIVHPNTLIIGGWVFGIFYWSIMGKKMLELEDLDRSHFKITDSSQN
eukprot:TRINITY_DN1025_c0_g2_i1.p1 TRINITY_DN1025_c0_g2~~TRINITY_DN1025_c0_g2_i1.p1  ORF type:complete len:496 (+),score=52.49 TRINITY_DN1025_c0_g2_i1:50-1537(+)